MVPQPCAHDEAESGLVCGEFLPGASVCGELWRVWLVSHWIEFMCECHCVERREW